MSQRFAYPLVALLLCSCTKPASAQLENFVEVCGDVKASASDVVNACQRALGTGKLSKRAEAQVRTNLGVALYDLTRYREAVDEYSAAVQAEPGLIAAYLNRARANEKLGLLREAVADYAEVLRLDPNSADAYVGRGAMLLSNGDPARAVGDLNRAITLEPGWISPYFNRGLAYLQLRDYGRSELDFSTVISRNSQDAGAFLNRGRARAALGNQAAASDFDQALALAPEWGGAWFARGRYRDQLGQRDAANGDFIRAFELGYPDPWLQKRIREIN
ncbi:MAG: tetratricopeptide repeat protein [Pseudomonadota bacterium]